MHKLEKTFVTAALLSMLLGLTHSATACTPAILIPLKPVSALEYWLPTAGPMEIFNSNSSCPQVVWPFVFDGLTDAQIIKYSGGTIPTPPPQAIPEWESAKPYLAGNKVSYSGKVYAARYWTQAETPGASSFVWDEQADLFGNPATWSGTKAFPGAAKVTYGANIYSAKWWTQGETPGVAGNAWTLVGLANGRRPAMFHVSANNDPLAPDFMKLNWNTDWTSLADAPLADNWKVMVNGVVVQEGTGIPSAQSDCAPNTPSCVSKYSQNGSFAVRRVRDEQLTFWLCAGTVCRPSPRVHWEVGGRAVQAPPQ